MNELDAWRIDQVRPRLWPAESPQSAAWGVEYRTTLDLATNKTSLPYHFVVFTSERCSVPAQENAAAGPQRLLVLPALS